MSLTNAKYDQIISQFGSFITNKDYPCVAARAAGAHDSVKCLVVAGMAEQSNDKAILEFLYDFVDEHRISKNPFNSAAIIFDEKQVFNEKDFDSMMWKKLQSLSDLDAQNYPYDKRVSPDTSSPAFSFSLKEEAFFVIALHPHNSRLARQFEYPVLVFNPHDQFEKLRATHRYEAMKTIVRNRDLHYSGSINPMLSDYNTSSEVSQYSGKVYDESWKCPLHIKHGKD